MNDAGVLIRTALMSTALTSTVGAGSSARLWANQAVPAKNYKPSDGIGIAFRVRGGRTMYHNGYIEASTQFKIYGSDELIANTGYRALVDVLHDQSPPPIRMAYLEQLGQTLEEQAPLNWPYVLAYFTIWLPRD